MGKDDSSMPYTLLEGSIKRILIYSNTRFDSFCINNFDQYFWFLHKSYLFHDKFVKIVFKERLLRWNFVQCEGGGSSRKTARSICQSSSRRDSWSICLGPCRRDSWSPWRGVAVKPEVDSYEDEVNQKLSSFS